jgi:hypothetical protein
MGTGAISRALGLVVFLCVGALGAPPAVRAQAGDTAYLEVVRQALAEFDAGNHMEALTLFQRAYELHPSARVLRGLAKTRFELRQYVECVDAAEQALASQLDPLTPPMQAEMQDLVQRASQFLGTLALTVEPVGTAVLVDGREVPAAQLGAPMRVTMGQHTIEGSHTGYEPGHRIVDVPGGATIQAHLALTPVAVAAAAPVAATDDSALLIAGIVVGSVGVLVTAIGGGWLGDRMSQLDYCVNQAPTFGAICRNAGAIQGERDGAAATLTIGLAALVAGGVLLGVYLGGHHDTPPSATAFCAPSLGGGTVDGAICAGAVRW